MNFIGTAVFILAVVAVVAAERPTECPAEQETDWSIELLLRHDDCDKFYKCVFGQGVVQQCPDNLWFNLELSKCDWRENVDCSDRNVPGEVKPEPDPDSDPEPEPEPEPESEPEFRSELDLNIGVQVQFRV